MKILAIIVAVSMPNLLWIAISSVAVVHGDTLEILMFGVQMSVLLTVAVPMLIVNIHKNGIALPIIIPRSGIGHTVYVVMDIKVIFEFIEFLYF